MKLEKKENPILFTYTQIPDIFFTQYLSQAKGDYIKVYLYLLFLSKYNKDIKRNDLSKILNLPFSSIEEAINYLEQVELLTKKGNGFIVNNIQEMALHTLYHPNLTSSPEEVKKTAKNQYRAKAIENINNQFFQGVMAPTWYNDIDLWFKKYGFDEQVMIALFGYCFNKSALHKNYVQAVAEGWAKNNIKTYSDLDNYFLKQDKLNKVNTSISKKLRLTRPLTQYEQEYIEKWIQDFGYSMEIIEIALKRTTSKANFSFDYIDKLLTNWHERNLSTVKDIDDFLSEMKQKNKEIKTMEKKQNFQNYDQRTYDDLDSLYINNTFTPKKG